MVEEGAVVFEEGEVWVAGICGTAGTGTSCSSGSSCVSWNASFPSSGTTSYAGNADICDSDRASSETSVRPLPPTSEPTTTLTHGVVVTPPHPHPHHGHNHGVAVPTASLTFTVNQRRRPDGLQSLVHEA